MFVYFKLVMVKSPAKLVKKCEGRDSLSDILQRHVRATNHSLYTGRETGRNLSENRYLRNRIFSPQQAAQIQSDLTLRDL